MPNAEQIWTAFRADPDHDMWDYSPLLRALASKCQKVAEIGVRDGVSTSAFLLGLRESGGHLWSIDKNPRCAGTVTDAAEGWTFVCGDSQDPASIRPQLPEEVDLLLIDGDHNALPVRADLENYAPRVRSGGKILMHDITIDFPITPYMISKGWQDCSGIRPVFEEYVRRNAFAWKIIKGRFGLGIIQKTRVLIGVLSCERDRALNQALRETSYQASPWHRFFVAYPATRPDEVTVACPDDYAHLAAKTQEMARWALAQGYDYLFKTDADTYIDIERLLAAVLEPPVAGADYCGFYKGGPGDYAKGLGYWLSRRALEIVAGLPLQYSDDVRNPGDCLAEDRWVGHWLMAHGIACLKDERYRVQEPGPEPGNEVIAVHRQNTPEKVHASHARRQG